MLQLICGYTSHSGGDLEVRVSFYAGAKADLDMHCVND